MVVLIHVLDYLILQFDLKYQYIQYNSSNLIPTAYHFCEIINVCITALHGIIERELSSFSVLVSENF